MALFDLLVTALLFLNSLAILNEDRFLAKCAAAGTLHSETDCSCVLTPHGLFRQTAGTQAPTSRRARRARASKSRRWA